MGQASSEKWTGGGRSAFFLLLICFVLRLVSLVRPCLSDDEATYSVVAREMLAGHVLYVDVIDHKPPLIYLTYAATEAIAGRVGGMRLLHLITIGVVFATSLLLGRIARTFRGADAQPSRWPDEAFFAGLFYVVFTAALLDFDALAANCELFMLLPLTASVLLYLRSIGSHGGLMNLMGAGALAGVAFLYKYQGAVNLPLFALHLILIHRGRVAGILAGWGALTAGFLLVLALYLMVLVRVGASRPAWFWFQFNFSYIAQGAQGLTSGEVLGRLARVCYGVIPSSLIWILGVGAVSRSLRGGGPPVHLRSQELFATGWLVVSVLATAAGGRFFGHYFHQMTAPLAVLAAPAARKLWRIRPRLMVAGMAVPAVVFFLLGVFHEQTMAFAGEPDPDYPTLAAFIRDHSSAKDRLVIWGNLPVLYFEADRPLGSRFVFSNYLTGLSPATRTQSDARVDASANVVSESWAMFESDLADRRPALFIDTAPGNIAAYGKFPLSRYPRLQAIINSDYTPIDQIAGVTVFARRAR